MEKERSKLSKQLLEEKEEAKQVWEENKLNKERIKELEKEVKG